MDNVDFTFTFMLRNKAKENAKVMPRVSSISVVYYHMVTKFPLTRFSYGQISATIFMIV